MHIVALNRFPVKGLSPEPVERMELRAGDFVPGDRLYAIENGPCGFDPDDPKFFPKIKFLMLMKQGRLAALDTRYDDSSRVLTIFRDGKPVAAGDLGEEEGRRRIEDFFRDYCAGELRGPPKVLVAPSGFRFTDSLHSGFVSFVNEASLKDIEGRVGDALDPQRFRANAIIRGPAAWEESTWVGKTLAIGDLRLKIVKQIERCAAVNVRPGTGARDLDLMKTMLRAYGSLDCGFYAEVTSSGPLALGDELALIG